MQDKKIHIGPITTPDCPDPTAMPRSIRLRENLSHRDTVYLEAATWDALCRIAQEQKRTVDDLCCDIVDLSASATPFEQAARFYVLGHLAGKIPDHIELPPELRMIKELLGARRSFQ